MGVSWCVLAESDGFPAVSMGFWLPKAEIHLEVKGVLRWLAGFGAK